MCVTVRLTYRQLGPHGCGREAVNAAVVEALRAHRLVWVTNDRAAQTCYQLGDVRLTRSAPARSPTHRASEEMSHAQ